MLTLTVGNTEHYDEVAEEFSYRGGVELQLEHSLVSLSKWESKWEKAFLGPSEKTTEEMLGYVECMILTPDYPSDILERLNQEDLDKIGEYINLKSTATWFKENQPQAKSREVLTNELIYYWMFSAEIPIECEEWHLNRLFTLIKVFGLKNSKPKKMSRAEMLAQNRAENARRREEAGTRG